MEQIDCNADQPKNIRSPREKTRPDIRAAGIRPDRRTSGRHQFQGHQTTASPLAFADTARSPFRKAILLMTRTPCSAKQKQKPTGMSSRSATDQPARIGGMLTGSARNSHERRPAVPTNITTAGSNMKQPAENIDPRLRALREFSRYDVDAHVVVALQRPRGDERAWRN